MTGYEIRVRTVKESLLALTIQRGHKIDKDYRCREYTLLCSLAMDKTTAYFYTCPLGDRGPWFLHSEKLWLLCFRPFKKNINL